MLECRSAAGFVLALVLPVAAFAQSAPTPAPAPRAVIELFTSQGCSSCPAADRLLRELAADPSLIAVSLAIDTWDYLGWKDTLALAGHGTRQKVYAKARGDREIYTPQAVINGSTQVVGSDRAAIDGAIGQNQKAGRAPALAVTVSQSADAISVTLPAMDGAGHAEVWLCPTAKAVPVAIGRGENSGKSITYSHVVRRWVKAGDWDGKAETFTVPLARLRAGGADMVTVLVQRPADAAPRAIVGAAQVAMR